jgi:hypothetical protein
MMKQQMLLVVLVQFLDDGTGDEEACSHDAIGYRLRTMMK